MVENPDISIAAIDNGLAFPFKHPDEWRACKYLSVCLTLIMMNNFMYYITPQFYPIGLQNNVY